MGWAKCARLTAGGYWRCRVRTLEASRRWREANQEKSRESCCRYWHKADGGYIRRRKRQLVTQRGQVESELAELQKELMHLDT